MWKRILAARHRLLSADPPPPLCLFVALLLLFAAPCFWPRLCWRGRRRRSVWRRELPFPGRGVRLVVMRPDDLRADLCPRRAAVVGVTFLLRVIAVAATVLVAPVLLLRTDLTRTAWRAAWRPPTVRPAAVLHPPNHQGLAWFHGGQVELWLGRGLLLAFQMRSWAPDRTTMKREKRHGLMERLTAG